MGKHEAFTSEQQAILEIANALAETATGLARHAHRVDRVVPANYTIGYLAALQDILDEFGAVVPAGWQA